MCMQGAGVLSDDATWQAVAMTNYNGMKRGTPQRCEPRHLMPALIDAGGHSRMSASVMAGIAGVKAAVATGAMAGACCRLRAAAPEATARAAVVAAMNFIAVCWWMSATKQAGYQPNCSRSETLMEGAGRNEQQSTMLCQSSGRHREQRRLRGGTSAPPDLTGRQAHLWGLVALAREVWSAM